MASYFLPLSAIAVSILIVTSQTESSRVVTIQRPLLITQERKTPAYFAYQQTQKLEQANNNKQQPVAFSNSRYLSNLSLNSEKKVIQLAGMNFSKKEFLAPNWDVARKVASANKAVDFRIENTANKLAISQPLFQNENEFSSDSSNNLSPLKKWGTLRGKFELTDGVGIVDHVIELKRIEEGRIKEIGIVNLTAGLYSIDVESPKGYLIAQIKDKSGRLVGEDRERIINLQSRGLYYEGPFLKVGKPDILSINPSYPGGGSRSSTASAVLKIYDFNQATESAVGGTASATIFNNEKTLDNIEEAYTNISSNSSTIARLFDPSGAYKNITTIRYVGEKADTPLFTSKWIDGVLSYVSEVRQIEYMNKEGTHIIGRILVDNKPAAGVTVQITAAPGLSPIYLDQFMIPALSNGTTTENGYFMFASVEPGPYQITAYRKGVAIATQMFIAEEGSVAFQNISSSLAPKNKIVRSFDAFSSSVVAVDAIFADLDGALDVSSGQATFNEYSEYGVNEILVNPSERQYLPIRYNQNSKSDYVHLPLIQDQWLEAIKNSRKITQSSAHGIILAFTSELNYDAYLTLDDYNKENIVYFDANGNITDQPVIGGGFILFNIPFGAREVVLQDRNGDKIYSQVFNIVSDQISVSHFNAEL